jgi:hypothetical protein
MIGTRRGSGALPVAETAVRMTFFTPCRERSAWHFGSFIYVETAGTGEDPIAVPFGIAAGRGERNQPAESQELGTENSEQPQSRQIWTSGEGVKGGWLNVRGLFR